MQKTTFLWMEFEFVDFPLMQHNMSNEAKRRVMEIENPMYVIKSSKNVGSGIY